MNKKNKIIIFSLFILISLSLSIILLIIKKDKMNVTDKSLSGLAVYASNGIDYEADDEIPTGSSYSLNTDLSYCKGNGEIGEYDSTNGTISFEFTSGDSCYLYFDRETVYAYDSVNDKYYIKSGVNAAEGISGLYEVDTTNLGQDTHNATYTNTRYMGANPDNYACFDDGEGGCINYTKSTGVETTAAAGLFRIMGVFNTDTHGITGKQLVKLITADSYGNTTWNSNFSSDWSAATLKTSLSETYLTSALVNTQANMISTVTWHLGGYSDYKILASAFYTYERGTTVYSGRPTKWTGKIGLMYPSDFGYVTSGGTTTRNTCLTSYNLGSWYLYSDCYTNDWLLYPGARTGTQGTASNQWTISPYTEDAGQLFIVTEYGFIGYDLIFYSNGVRPAFYLESSVYVAGGTGTSTDPYLLAMDSVADLSASGLTVTATINMGNGISSFGLSSSRTDEPTTWLTSDDNGTLSGTSYNLSYTASEAGTYYLWAKDANGNTIVSSDSVTLTS